METDQARVNAAVKIKISLVRNYARRTKLIEKIRSLEKDLSRLLNPMNQEEYTQYIRRIQ